MTITTTRYHLPAVFLAVAAMIGSLLIGTSRDAEATHPVNLKINGATAHECAADGSTNGSITFEIELNTSLGADTFSDRDIFVDFETVAIGTATEGDDYPYTEKKPLKIPQGTVNTTTVSVPLFCNESGGDAEEQDETFGVYLFNPVNAGFASENDQKATGTIVDGPVQGPSFEIAWVTNPDNPDPDKAVRERDPGLTTPTVAAKFNVTLDDTGPCPCTVDYTTQDGTATSTDDYNGTSGKLTFERQLNDAAQTKSFTVSIKHDNDPETQEHFFAVLSNNQEATENTYIPSPSAKAEILDDDIPALSVVDAVVSEGAGTFAVPFELDLAIDEDIYIVWRSADGSAKSSGASPDYTGTGGTITTKLAKGQTKVSESLGLNDDTSLESWHENFYAQIECLNKVDTTDCSNDANRTTKATEGDTFGRQSIQDDEPKINVSDASATEGEKMTFTVTLEQFREGQDISVKYATMDGTNATAGDDYQSKSGTLTWNQEDRDANNKTKTVTVETLQDGESEGNHAFTLELSEPSFAGIGDGTGQGLITDDDAFNVDAGPAKSGESATEVSFTGSAQCPDTCTYSWDFGDGGTANGVTVKHRYDETGTYTVTFTVESSSGSTASDTTTATITDSGKVDRDWGDNRVKTAVAVSSKNWNQADTVLLATGYNFPDALAAGPLAQKLDAPLLLTHPNGLPQEVKDELDRLNAKKVVILGGPNAVPQSQADELARDYQIQRIAGTTRFGTAADIATEVGATSANEVTIALGQHADPNRDEWPDALSAGSFASLADPLPALLTHSDFVPQETLDALENLGTKKVFLLGGSVAIKDAVEAQLEAEGYTVQRVFGQDRYETSKEAAAIVMSRYPAGQVHPVFATGQKYPDGLSGGALAGKVTGPVLLVPQSSMDDAPGSREVRTFLREHANRFDVGTVVGGTAVISDNVKNQVRSDIDKF